MGSTKGTKMSFCTVRFWNCFDFKYCRRFGDGTFERECELIIPIFPYSSFCMASDLTLLSITADGSKRQNGWVHQHSGSDVPERSPDAHVTETQRHPAGRGQRTGRGWHGHRLLDFLRCTCFYILISAGDGISKHWACYESQDQLFTFCLKPALYT